MQLFNTNLRVAFFRHQRCYFWYNTEKNIKQTETKFRISKLNFGCIKKTVCCKHTVVMKLPIYKISLIYNLGATVVSCSN